MHTFTNRVRELATGVQGRDPGSLWQQRRLEAMVAQRRRELGEQSIVGRLDVALGGSEREAVVNEGTRAERQERIVGTGHPAARSRPAAHTLERVERLLQLVRAPPLAEALLSEDIEVVSELLA